MATAGGPVWVEIKRSLGLGRLNDRTHAGRHLLYDSSTVEEASPAVLLYVTFCKITVRNGIFYTVKFIKDLSGQESLGFGNRKVCCG